MRTLGPHRHRTMEPGALVSDQYGRPVDPAAFAAAMAPLSIAIAAYCEAVARQPQENGHLPATASKAMAEYAEQAKWSTPAWQTPARNAYAQGGFLLQFVADHVSAIGATIAHSSIGPAYAHLSLMRAIIESAPVAYWLLDPTIALETRLKRSCYRIDSADQLGRNTHLPKAKIDSKNGRQKASAFAGTHKWSRYSNPLSIGGEKIPHPSKEFTKLLYGTADPELDKTLWNYLSATMHGAWYAIVQNLHLTETADPLDTDGALGAVLIEAKQLTMYSVVAWRACAKVVDARENLMGWTRSDDHARAHESMAKHEANWFAHWSTAS